jgi:hypothetical protein
MSTVSFEEKKKRKISLSNKFMYSSKKKKYLPHLVYLVFISLKPRFYATIAISFKQNINRHFCHTHTKTAANTTLFNV